MIATLSGKLKLREPGRLIVETAGVGYEIFVPLSTYYRMPSVGVEIELAPPDCSRRRDPALWLRDRSGKTRVRSFDGRAARWLQARARRAIRTLTTRSGSCDHA